MALGPFLYMHAQDGALFQPPDRVYTVKHRRLALAWSSLNFYPETNSTCKSYRLNLKKISRFPVKERKKMEELCKVTRILFIYFLTGKVDRRCMI